MFTILFLQKSVCSGQKITQPEEIYTGVPVAPVTFSMSGTGPNVFLKMQKFPRRAKVVVCFTERQD